MLHFLLLDDMFSSHSVHIIAPSFNLALIFIEGMKERSNLSQINPLSLLMKQLTFFKHLYKGRPQQKFDPSFGKMI